MVWNIYIKSNFLFIICDSILHIEKVVSSLVNRLKILKGLHSWILEKKKKKERLQACREAIIADSTR